MYIPRLAVGPCTDTHLVMRLWGGQDLTYASVGLAADPSLRPTMDASLTILTPLSRVVISVGGGLAPARKGGTKATPGSGVVRGTWTRGTWSCRRADGCRPGVPSRLALSRREGREGREEDDEEDEGEEEGGESDDDHKARPEVWSSRS